MGCESGTVGEDCQAPLSTMTMRSEWAKAYALNIDCQDRADLEDFKCILRADPNEDCGAQFNLAQRWCVYWYARQANKIPLRECGITVINILGTPDELDINESLIEPNDEDEDMDGIPNYWEFIMGYNPCTAHSFGCSFPSDGSDDFDADGIPDSEDEWPICNMGNDPADYGSDCV